MLINKRYLIIPTSDKATTSKLRFFENGQLMLDLFVQLDTVTPEYNMYYDMINFLNRDIEISSELTDRFSLTDEINTFDESRPLVHFTPDWGWLNDPNGLICYEGKYHMFFQSNPVSRYWNNMHWDHAVSDDLMNWTQVDFALFPDELGDMFSGSAIIDYDNILGLKDTEHEVVVLFYTACGNISELSEGGRNTQCIAYSTDGLKTFKKYSGNPIIPGMSTGDRDPKVFYHSESGYFVMPLYMGKHEFKFFKSKNLINWEGINSYMHPIGRECPDLLHFGDKYILTEANEYYVIGSFDIEKGFIPESEPKKLGYGESYAAQTFFGTEDIIKIAWNRFSHMPSKVFNCEMSIPYKLEFDGNDLRNIPYIKSKLMNEFSDFTEDNLILKKDAYDIEFETMGDNEITLFGNKINIKSGELSITALNGETYTMPTDNKIRIITDTVGFEIFSHDYKKFGAFEVINDFGSDALKCKNPVKNLKISTIIR